MSSFQSLSASEYSYIFKKIAEKGTKMENRAEGSPDENYDAVIVGGGPAGITAGFILAKSDLKVLLVEKSEFPRKKVCGGLLTHKNMMIIEKVFDRTAGELREEEVISEPRYNYRMDYNGRKIRDFSLTEPMYFTEREEYDDFFLMMAREEGLDVCLGEKVIDIQVETNTLETESGRIIQGNFIIGADGVNSTVRKKIETKFDPKRWNRYVGVAIQGRFEKGCLDDLDHHVLDFGFLGSGYGWIFPHEDHVKIGVGGLNKADMRSYFNDFLNARNVEKSVKDVNGSSIPFGCYIPSPAFKNILLVGDAAGLMNPLTGEGIYYAHRSGELAASSIIKHLKGGSVSAGDLYRRAIQEEIIPEFDRSMLVRKLFWSTKGRSQRALIDLFSPLLGKRMNMLIQKGTILNEERVQF